LVNLPSPETRYLLGQRLCLGTVLIYLLDLLGIKFCVPFFNILKQIPG
jgi:hypothetical protein